MRMRTRRARGSALRHSRSLARDLGGRYKPYTAVREIRYRTGIAITGPERAISPRGRVTVWRPERARVD